MRIYLDTGVFLDYLALRGHVGPFLRTAGRRGRTVDQLVENATKCLLEISFKHHGFTSSLTLYEVEHSMYETLKSVSSGLPDHHRYLITSARALTVQVLSMVKYNNVQVIDLTQSVFEKVVSEIELQSRAIQAADSIHIATALQNDADVIISTDDHILKLNDVFENRNGLRIQCMDTDDALGMLGLKVS